MTSRRTLPYRLTQAEKDDFLSVARTKLRHERLVEVRRQSHRNAKKIREKAERAARFHALDERHKREDEWRSGRDREIRWLEDVYDERLRNIGAAHAAARAERDPKTVEAAKKVVRDARARSRGSEARQVLRALRENEARAAAVPVRRRKFARVVEDERAKMISGLKGQEDEDEEFPAVGAEKTENVPAARRLWIGPDWPPDAERRRLLREPIPADDVVGADGSSDPVAAAEAETAREADAARRRLAKERRLREAAERRHRDALARVRLADDHRRLMLVLRDLHREKVAGNRAALARAAADAAKPVDLGGGRREVEEEEEEPSLRRRQSSTADGGLPERIGRSRADYEGRTTPAAGPTPSEVPAAVDEKEDDELERRYRALIEKGRALPPPPSPSSSPLKAERTFGDLDYFPQRDPGASPSNSKDSSSGSSPRGRRFRARPGTAESGPGTSPSKVARMTARRGREKEEEVKKRKKPQPVESSPSSIESSSSSTMGPSSPVAPPKPRRATIHVRGDVLTRYVTRALDRLDLSQLTSSPSSTSTSTAASFESEAEPSRARERGPAAMQRRPIPPPCSGTVDLDGRREEALRRVLKSSRGRLNAAEAAWLASRICEKFQVPPPSSSSPSSSSRKPSSPAASSSSSSTAVARNTASRGILKTSSSSAGAAHATTTTMTTTSSASTRDSVLREIDAFLRQLGAVLDERARDLTAATRPSPSSTSVSASTASSSSSSDLTAGLLTRILEDFAGAAHTAAVAFGTGPGPGLGVRRVHARIEEAEEGEEEEKELKREEDEECDKSDYRPEEKILTGVTASSSSSSSSSSPSSTAEGGILVGETASSVEADQRSSAQILAGETASVSSSGSYNYFSASGGRRTRETVILDLDKITSTPKAGASTATARQGTGTGTGSGAAAGGRLLKTTTSTSSSSAAGRNVTPAGAVRAIPFDTSLSTIRTKETGSHRSTSSSSPPS